MSWQSMHAVRRRLDLEIATETIGPRAISASDRRRAAVKALAQHCTDPLPSSCNSWTQLARSGEAWRFDTELARQIRLTRVCSSSQFGRQSGSVESFSYTEANKKAAVHWDENTLFDYLEVSPRSRHRCVSDGLLMTTYVLMPTEPEGQLTLCC